MDRGFEKLWGKAGRGSGRPEEEPEPARPESWWWKEGGGELSEWLQAAYEDDYVVLGVAGPLPDMADECWLLSAKTTGPPDAHSDRPGGRVCHISRAERDWLLEAWPEALRRPGGIVRPGGVFDVEGWLVAPGA